MTNAFEKKTSGTYWVVANLLGLRNTLTRLRTFFLDEKEESNKLLQDSIDSLGLQERVLEWLQNASLQNLPVSTVKQLRKALGDSVRLYLKDKGVDMIKGFSVSINWENIAELILNRLRNSSVINNSLSLVSQELALVIERYLERDLEKIVAEAIPILNIDSAIIARVKGTSAQDLEVAVNGIVRSELQAIVNLGGILGVVIGLFQTIFLLTQQ